MNDKRVENRRTPAERRGSDRRQLPDRRQNVVEVSFERRVAGRRFVERRAEVRRRLNDRRHLLVPAPLVPDNVKIGVKNDRPR